MLINDIGRIPKEIFKFWNGITGSGFHSTSLCAPELFEVVREELVKRGEDERWQEHPPKTLKKAITA